MNWDKVVKKVTPHVVKIETPVSSGTGFLLLYNDTQAWCCIATADHVVSYADEWQQPIRLIQPDADNQILLAPLDRVIYRNWSTDSAVILFLKGDFQLPEIPITLFPVGQLLDIGSEVGWLGFPAIAPQTLCFFSGIVSARQGFRKAYLLDGVAINGVSGGPVLHLTGTDGVQIIGVVSAYNANRTAGEALPGLAIAQDVSHFHNVAAHVHSLDEANRKKAQFERQQQISNQET